MTLYMARPRGLNSSGTSATFLSLSADGGGGGGGENQAAGFTGLVGHPEESNYSIERQSGESVWSMERVERVDGRGRDTHSQRRELSILWCTRLDSARGRPIRRAV